MSRTHHLMYIYRRGRQGAITSSFDIKEAHDFCTAIAKTWELRRLPGLFPAVLCKLNDDVYASFSLMIYKSLYTYNNFTILTNIIDDLKQKAPDIKFCHGIKQKIETFLFRSIPHFYIYLRMLHWKWIMR